MLVEEEREKGANRFEVELLGAEERGERMEHSVAEENHGGGGGGGSGSDL